MTAPKYTDWIAHNATPDSACPPDAVGKRGQWQGEDETRLEWQTGGRYKFTAETNFGQFGITEFDGPPDDILRTRMTDCFGNESWFTSVKAAQSAAQADYTARILAALNPDAVLALVAAAYADALKSIADLPTPMTEDQARGHEDAYRAIEDSTPTDATAALERVKADARAEGLEMAAKRITGAQALPIDVGGSVVLDATTVDACATAIRAMKGEGA